MNVCWGGELPRGSPLRHPHTTTAPCRFQRAEWASTPRSDSARPEAPHGQSQEKHGGGALARAALSLTNGCPVALGVKK